MVVENPLVEPKIQRRNIWGPSLTDQWLLVPRVRKFHIDKCHDQEKTRGENVFPQSTLDSRSQSFKIPSLQRRKLDVPLLQACHVLLFKIHQGLRFWNHPCTLERPANLRQGWGEKHVICIAMPGHFERVPFAKLSNKGQVSQVILILKLYTLKFELLVWQHHPCPTNAEVFNVLRGFALKPLFWEGKRDPACLWPLLSTGILGMGSYQSFPAVLGAFLDHHDMSKKGKCSMFYFQTNTQTFLG